MRTAWQLIQALEEGKVLSKNKKEFIVKEGNSFHHYLKRTSSPWEELILHPERWEIISVQKFEKLFANS